MRIVAVIAFLVFGLIAVGLIALTPGQPPTVSREQYNLAANQAAQLQTSLDAERQNNAVLTTQRSEAERRADAGAPARRHLLVAARARQLCAPHPSVREQRAAGLFA
jgi:hypothetical protein